MTRVFKISLLLSLISGVLTAEAEDWKCVASISGMDKISEIHIINLLQSHGIKSVIEGSLAYGILVPPAKAELASQMLRTNAAKLGYMVWFGSNDLVRAAEPKQLIARRPVSSALKEPAYISFDALDADLAAVLVKQWSPTA
jgi:hypothetical protein